MAQTSSINDIMNLINEKITSEPAGKKLLDAEGNSRFWVHNGPVLRNLVELRDALRHISDDQFNHHVTKDRNDFSNWAEHVLHETDLAKKLKNYKSRKSALKMVDVFLKKNYGL